MDIYCHEESIMVRLYYRHICIIMHCIEFTGGNYQAFYGIISLTFAIFIGVVI
jgi:hypothetical protein